MNYIAVLVAAVAAVALGSLWYGPLFGKAWMKTLGFGPEDLERMKNDPAGKKKMMRSYAIMAVGSLIMSFVLARTLIAVNTTEHIAGVGLALKVAFWYWLGFVAPVSISGVLWESKSWKWWFITAGYYLVSLFVMGVIITLFT